jgi:hypothetical protein
MKSNVKRNTLPTLLSAIALAGVMAASAHAQMLGGLSVSPPAAKVGEPVTVTASIDVVSANYCGFIVFFGDGTSAESVIDVNKPSPFVVSHTYAKAGQFTLSLGGRSVQSHPNCGGADKMATVTITEAAKPAAAPVAEPAKPAMAKTTLTAATACPAKWKLVSKSFNAKTGAFSCSAKPGTELPKDKTVCAGDLTYFENVKKGQLGCRP